MATRLPSALPRRPMTAFPFSPLNNTHISTPYLAPSHTPLSRTPSRAATLIRRPRRPYSFTQLVQLSDGSTYTMRTSSPLGMYKSTKDTRNHALWNPNDKSLQNVEVDEAGKLAAFRARFGRSWDAGTETVEEDQAKGSGGAAAASAKKDVGSEDALADLIAGYAAGVPDSSPKKK
ncbi:hypothetical protein F5B22DRAFT_352335 [Xylaria bambusicola]|uniref:uncharacterized protein n=1 Tax=Xylaria bambusicola TaxID=326684 RepID=UPI002007CBE4|nr:uncharacterized protein F5B22DRAFT_352335 [Xylaria bambusicola]KAI0525622.1 hypothetical protein F5B22DRAFT_352335 [Xylaria bambusicola]